MTSIVATNTAKRILMRSLKGHNRIRRARDLWNDAARDLGCDPDGPLTGDEAAAILAACGITGTETEALVRLAAELGAVEVTQ